MASDPAGIGVFGGSFDPPHIGHFICARIAAEKLALTKVILVPTAVQPHKLEGAGASAEARWRMLCAAVAREPLFEPSRVELDRGGLSYTVDTLDYLSKIYPKPRYQLDYLLGMDALNDIVNWREPDRIFELARLAVMCRSGQTLPELPPHWLMKTMIVDTPQIDISSTMIRRRLKEGLLVDWMVPPEALKIIRRESLYR
jgi:nicotinate-nucleotide adenylyltransferase